MNDILQRLSRLSPEMRAILAAQLTPKNSAPASTRLAAFIVPSAGRKIDPENIRDVLADRLPEYMIPGFILTMDALPLTPNGKVDRKILEKMEPVIARSESKFTNPTNETEKLLTRIWSEVLSLESISILDNFFELGGDSILSIHIVARARQAGLEITPALLFKHPTVAELAGYLDNNQKNAPKEYRDEFEF
jgi:aryl carrier-like protein